MVAKLPERGKESKIEWLIVQVEQELESIVDLELITSTPKVPDPDYSKMAKSASFKITL